MQVTSKDITQNPVAFYLIIISFIIPPCFYQMAPSSILNILSLWDKYIGVPVFLLCVLAIVGARKDLEVGDVILYYGYKIAATVIVTLAFSGTITGGGSFHHLRQLAAICFIAIALRRNYKLTVSRLTYILSALVILNFLTILAFPHGMYNDGNWENYLLGYDNGHAVVFMPSLLLSFEYAYLTRKYSLTVITWISVFASAAICKSGVTVAGLALLVFLLLLIHFPGVRKFLFNWKTVLIGITLVFVLIVILRMQENYSGLIMSVFHKDSTLTERTVLWDRAFAYIKDNPILGTGDNNRNNIKMFYIRSQNLAYAHNEVLDVLVRSGIIGLLLYLNCIIHTFATIKQRKDNHIKTWLAIMAAYWVMMLFESYSNYSFYYLYFVMIMLPRYEPVLDYKRKIIFRRRKLLAQKRKLLCTNRSFKC